MIRKTLFAFIFVGAMNLNHLTLQSADDKLDVSIIEDEEIRNLTSEFHLQCQITHLCVIDIPDLHEETEFSKPCCKDCSCSFDCMATRSCCPDRVTSLVTLEQVEQEESYNHQCIPAQYRRYDREFHNGLSYRMIVGCPRGYGNITILNKCYREYRDIDFTDPSVFQFLPVTNSVSKLIYKNSYCALCHNVGAERSLRWQIAVSCSEGNPFISNLREIKDVVNDSNGTCNLIFKPWIIPGFGESQYQNCGIDRCNVSGLWKNYDPSLEAKCLSYESVYEGFKNIHCYFCNGFKRERLEHECFGGHLPPNARSTFLALLDFNDLEENKFRDELADNEEECARGQFYDWEKSICREANCSLGMHLAISSDRCVSSLRSLNKPYYEMTLAFLPLPNLRDLRDYYIFQTKLADTFAHRIQYINWELCKMETIIKSTKDPIQTGLNLYNIEIDPAEIMFIGIRITVAAYGDILVEQVMKTLLELQQTVFQRNFEAEGLSLYIPSPLFDDTTSTLAPVIRTLPALPTTKSPPTWPPGFPGSNQNSPTDLPLSPLPPPPAPVSSSDGSSYPTNRPPPPLPVSPPFISPPAPVMSSSPQTLQPFPPSTKSSELLSSPVQTSPPAFPPSLSANGSPGIHTLTSLPPATSSWPPAFRLTSPSSSSYEPPMMPPTLSPTQSVSPPTTQGFSATFKPPSPPSAPILSSTSPHGPPPIPPAPSTSQPVLPSPTASPTRPYGPPPLPPSPSPYGPPNIPLAPAPSQPLPPLPSPPAPVLPPPSPPESSSGSPQQASSTTSPKPFWSSNDPVPCIISEDRFDGLTVYGLQPIKMTNSHCPASIPLNPIQFCPKVTLSNDDFKIDWNTKTINIHGAALSLNNSQILVGVHGKVVTMCVKQYVDLRSFVSQAQMSIRKEVSHIDVQFILSAVCICLSLVCLLLTFTVYSILPSLRTLPGINNMALVLSLFVTQVLFLVTSMVEINPKWLCKMAGVLVHFCLLSSFFWMNLCTFHMTKVFVSIKQQSTMRENITRSFIKYTCSVEAISLIIVAVNITVSSITSNNMVDIGYGEARSCYISQGDMIGYTVAIPLGFVVITDLLMFLYVIYKIERLPEIQSNAKQDRNNIIIFAKLSTITGLTWIFAFVYQFTAMELFAYLYIVTNAGQGMFIMLSFIMNRRVFNLLRGQTSKAFVEPKENAAPK